MSGFSYIIFAVKDGTDRVSKNWQLQAIGNNKYGRIYIDGGQAIDGQLRGWSVCLSEDGCWPAAGGTRREASPLSRERHLQRRRHCCAAPTEELCRALYIAAGNALLGIRLEYHLNDCSRSWRQPDGRSGTTKLYFLSTSEKINLFSVNRINVLSLSDSLHKTECCNALWLLGFRLVFMNERLIIVSLVLPLLMKVRETNSKYSHASWVNE